MFFDGLVHVTELRGEFYRFDEHRQELRGERTGIRYAIGTRVRVQVSRVDLDGRRIDFRLVREARPDLVNGAAKSDAPRPARPPGVRPARKRGGAGAEMGGGVRAGKASKPAASRKAAGKVASRKTGKPARKAGR